MPRGSISGQGRIQVRPPADWDVAMPESEVIIEEPGRERAKSDRHDLEKHGPVRSLRTRLADLIDPN
jgi:hypothetical protein